MDTMLLEVDTDNEEFQLTLMDGSKWFVNPGDLPTVATWIPTSETILERNTNSVFGFDLTNVSEGITIEAMQVV